jgi:hypothetical protein
VLLRRLSDWDRSRLFLHWLRDKWLGLFFCGSWLQVREVNLCAHIHMNGHNVFLLQLYRLLRGTFKQFRLNLRLLVTDIE